MQSSSPEEMKVRACLWGGFDVANYGDQLFPLIAKDQLSERLPNLELTCFAPFGQASLPPGSPPLFPISSDGGSLTRQRRDYFARHFDAVVVGGGDILRFDHLDASQGSPAERAVSRPYHAFLDPFWDEGGVRPVILWNAPGAPFPFEPTRNLLIRRACSSVRYLAVRDEVSRGYLLEAGVEEPIHVVPDTGILLDGVIRTRINEGEARELLSKRGAGINGRKTLCFQCNPGFLMNQEKSIVRALSAVADKYDLEVVLLPVGLCHGDRDALRRVQNAGGGRFTLVDGVESPIEMGALISVCDYFAGSSLHGNLTALSFGIPHLVVNTARLAKMEGFVQSARLEEFRITDWSDLESTLEKLVHAPRERWSAAADRLKLRASEHFDRLAALISHSAENREGSGENTPAPHTDSAPVEAYAVMAGLHESLEDERSAHTATRKELEGGARELDRLRLKLDRRDDHISARDRKIRDLSRKLRRLEDLRGLLDNRTEELAEKEQQVAELTQEVARRNHRLARFERPSGDAG